MKPSLIGCYKVKIAVLIYNPKVFREVIDRLRKINIDFYVPSTINELKELLSDAPDLSDHIFVMDDELMGLLNVRSHIPNLVLANEKNVLEVISRIILKLLGRERVGELVLGIDVGKLYAYVLIADGYVVDYGLVMSLSRVVKCVRPWIKHLNPKVLSVRIGELANIDVLKDLQKLGISMEVELIDESSSSKPPRYRPLNNVNLKEISQDLEAALNIALRSGIKVDLGVTKSGTTSI